MTDTQQYRLTRQVPLVRVEGFCRSLETALAGRYAATDLPVIWRRYISAECPRCGILICGEELRALAFPPCAESGSAKIGRLRLGDCARQGCETWHYDLHLWAQEGVDWPSLLEAAEAPGVSERHSHRFWAPGLWQVIVARAPRVAVGISLVTTLWVARQLYQGGRIPLFREPETFTFDMPIQQSDWPKAMDGSDKQ